jgi:hypothetical protein
MSVQVIYAQLSVRYSMPSCPCSTLCPAVRAVLYAQLSVQVLYAQLPHLSLSFLPGCQPLHPHAAAT